MMTDPIADMLTRIRNAQQIHSKFVTMPYSKLKKNIIDVFVDEGYVDSYEVIQQNTKRQLVIKLKYFEGRPVIEHVKRISKPGLRKYSTAAQLPKVMEGLGIAIISTSKGIMTDHNARKLNLGGEVICTLV